VPPPRFYKHTMRCAATGTDFFAAQPNVSRIFFLNASQPNSFRREFGAHRKAIIFKLKQFVGCPEIAKIAIKEIISEWHLPVCLLNACSYQLH